MNLKKFNHENENVEKLEKLFANKYQWEMILFSSTADDKHISKLMKCNDSYFILSYDSSMDCIYSVEHLTDIVRYVSNNLDEVLSLYLEKYTYFGFEYIVITIY